MVIKDVYSAVKGKLVPTQWAYHPDVDQVYKFRPIAALIDDPSDSKIGVHQCLEAFQELPGLVQALHEEKKAVLLSLVSQREGGSGGSDINLATAVFECNTPGCQGAQRPLIGWQRAICHTCDGHYGHHYYCYSGCGTITPTFIFSDRGFKAVESLASLLELDVQTAVPADYDQKLARFVCLNCNLVNRSGMHGREALTWRDCVSVA